MPLDYLQIALMLLTLILAVSTVELKNLLYAVISFCGMCIAIGALYWLMNAPYVAVFQLLIYAGAVVTIFLAALTLTKMKGGIK
jgi:NAD(P)H-quinone oxidoreductase subunit 6